MDRYGPGKGFKRANQQIDTLYAVIARNPDKIALTTTPAELKKNVRQGKAGCDDWCGRRPYDRRQARLPR